MTEDEIKETVLFLIGPPGQLRKALENKGYQSVDVKDEGEFVVAEFDCLQGDTEVHWFLENVGKNCRLALLGCSYIHRTVSMTSRVTARFQYGEDKTIQRVPVPRIR